jgi:hypothetical protein
MLAAGLAATVNTGDPPMSGVSGRAGLGRAGVAQLVGDGVSAAFLDGGETGAADRGRRSAGRA